MEDIVNGVLHLDHDFCLLTGLWYTYIKNFGCLYWLWRYKELSNPFRTYSGSGGHWGFLIQYGHWSLMSKLSKFWLFILIQRVKRTSMSSKSWLGVWRILKVLDWALESGSWFSFGHWSLICPFSKFWLLHDHKDAKNWLGLRRML